MSTPSHPMNAITLPTDYEVGVDRDQSTVKRSYGTTWSPSFLNKLRESDFYHAAAPPSEALKDDEQHRDLSTLPSDPHGSILWSCHDLLRAPLPSQQTFRDLGSYTQQLPSFLPPDLGCCAIPYKIKEGLRSSPQTTTGCIHTRSKTVTSSIQTSWILPCGHASSRKHRGDFSGAVRLC